MGGDRAPRRGAAGAEWVLEQFDQGLGVGPSGWERMDAPWQAHAPMARYLEPPAWGPEDRTALVLGEDPGMFGGSARQPPWPSQDLGPVPVWHPRGGYGLVPSFVIDDLLRWPLEPDLFAPGGWVEVGYTVDAGGWSMGCAVPPLLRSERDIVADILAASPIAAAFDVPLSVLGATNPDGAYREPPPAVDQAPLVRDLRAAGAIGVDLGDGHLPPPGPIRVRLPERAPTTGPSMNRANALPVR